MATDTVVNSSPVVQQIRAYERELEQGAAPRLPHCPHPDCSAERPEFRRHGFRERFFLVVVGQFVHQLRSFLSRWKCPVCKRTLTWYPPFALPHKRYLLGQVLERSRRFLEDESATYRDAVTEQNRPVYYAEDEPVLTREPEADEEKEADQPRVLTHSTVHRWLTTLGSLPETVRAAGARLKQKNPVTTLFRQLAGGQIPSRKYRSERRRRVLLAARALLLTAAEHGQTFRRALLPDSATAYSWR